MPLDRSSAGSMAKQAAGRRCSRSSTASIQATAISRYCAQFCFPLWDAETSPESLDLTSKDLNRPHHVLFERIKLVVPILVHLNLRRHLLSEELRDQRAIDQKRLSLLVLLLHIQIGRLKPRKMTRRRRAISDC